MTDPANEPALETPGTPEGEDGCIVCGRPAGGKALCQDDACAQSLAQG